MLWFLRDEDLLFWIRPIGGIYCTQKWLLFLKSYSNQAKAGGKRKTQEQAKTIEE